VKFKLANSVLQTCT